MRNKIYIAGKFGRQLEFREYAKELEFLGFIVNSRWLYEESTNSFETITEREKETYAMHDVEDVLAADILLQFTEKSDIGYTAGGRHVELGMALGQLYSGQKLKQVWFVGPRENIFHSLPALIQFDDFKQLQGCVRALQTIHHFKDKEDTLYDGSH